MSRGPRSPQQHVQAGQDPKLLAEVWGRGQRLRRRGSSGAEHLPSMHRPWAHPQLFPQSCQLACASVA
jgi:hypothetical protein